MTSSLSLAVGDTLAVQVYMAESLVSAGLNVMVLVNLVSVIFLLMKFDRFLIHVMLMSTSVSTAESTETVQRMSSTVPWYTVPSPLTDIITSGAGTEETQQHT